MVIDGLDCHKSSNGLCLAVVLYIKTNAKSKTLLRETSEDVTGVKFDIPSIDHGNLASVSKMERICLYV